MTTDFEMHSAPGWPGKQLYLGDDGARELAAEWMESLKVKWFFTWDEALEAAHVEEEVQ